MKTSFIYALNFRSRQFYVGSSNDPARRLEQHRKSCLSDKPKNRFLANVWKKFGEPKLKILLEVPENKVLAWEQIIIDQVFDNKNNLNLNTRADRPPSWKGRKHSAQHIENFKSSFKNNPEIRKKISAANKGKVVSVETREKISATLKGRNHSEEHSAKISASSPNKKAVVGFKDNQTIEFQSAVEASAFIGLSKSAVKGAIRRGKPCGGYTWTYK